MGRKVIFKIRTMVNYRLEEKNLAVTRSMVWIGTWIQFVHNFSHIYLN